MMKTFGSKPPKTTMTQKGIDEPNYKRRTGKGTYSDDTSILPVANPLIAAESVALLPAPRNIPISTLVPGASSRDGAIAIPFLTMLIRIIPTP